VATPILTLGWIAFQAGPNPAYVVPHPSNKFVYVCNETAEWEKTLYQVATSAQDTMSGVCRTDHAVSVAFLVTFGCAALGLNGNGKETPPRSASLSPLPSSVFSVCASQWSDFLSDAASPLEGDKYYDAATNEWVEVLPPLQPLLRPVPRSPCS